jgi:hypothetical protein
MLYVTEDLRMRFEMPVTADSHPHDKLSSEAGTYRPKFSRWYR